MGTELYEASNETEEKKVLRSSFRKMLIDGAFWARKMSPFSNFYVRSGEPSVTWQNILTEADITFMIMQFEKHLHW